MDHNTICAAHREGRLADYSLAELKDMRKICARHLQTPNQYMTHPCDAVEREIARKEDTEKQLDIHALVIELAALRQEVQKTATETDQKSAIEVIAAAEAAAQKGDMTAVAGHLKKTGKWLLGVAERIGVSIAAEVIKKSIGM